MGSSRNRSRKSLSGRKRTAAARIAKLHLLQASVSGSRGQSRRRNVPESEQGVRTPPPVAGLPQASPVSDWWLSGAPELTENDVLALTGDQGQGEMSQQSRSRVCFWAAIGESAAPLGLLIFWGCACAGVSKLLRGGAVRLGRGSEGAAEELNRARLSRPGGSSREGWLGSSRVHRACFCCVCGLTVWWFDA